MHQVGQLKQNALGLDVSSRAAQLGHHHPLQFLILSSLYCCLLFVCVAYHIV